MEKKRNLSRLCFIGVSSVALNPLDRESSPMPGFFVQYAWLIPFFPLLGAAVAAFGARRLRFHAHIPVVAGIALAFLYSLATLVQAGREETWTVMSWLTVRDLDIPLQVRVDGLSTMMLTMVTLVS